MPQSKNLPLGICCVCCVCQSKTCAWVLTSVDYDSLLSFFVFSMSLVGNHFQELSVEGDSYTPSDVERALWSSAVGTKLLDSLPNSEPKVNTKRKRKQWINDKQLTAVLGTLPSKLHISFLICLGPHYAWMIIH